MNNGVELLFALSNIYEETIDSIEKVRLADEEANQEYNI